MKAEILSIGTELLLGRIVNTNAAYLSQKLAELGIDLYYQSTVGDNPQRLIEAIRRALGRSNVVIMTGGLGPTIDDITLEAMKVFSGKRFTIPNKIGTAPGLIIEYKDKVIVCLPGPPRELYSMFEDNVIPYLKKRFKEGWIIRMRIIKTTGLRESKVNGIVKDLLKLRPPTTVGIYAKLGEVDLVIMAKAKTGQIAAKKIAKIEKKINGRLKKYVFGYDEETLEGAIGKLLTKTNKTIAIAESCTGGLISNRITDISGCSRYFKCSMVTYSNESKESFLGVKRGSLEKYGAVSKQAALEMAMGIKHFACVDIGVGVTGIAGPTGWAKGKPLGLVYIALVTDRKRIVKKFLFRGSRQDVKFLASQVALDLIRRTI